MDIEKLKAEIASAIKAHGEWRGKLRMAALKKDKSLPVADICRDDQCQFGQWLKKLPADIAKEGHVREIRAKHAAFHRHAGEIAQMIVNGKTEVALQTLSEPRYKEMTSELVRLLTRWKLRA